MKVEFVIKNDSHQDGTFFANGQWTTLTPGSITVVNCHPSDISVNLTVVKKLVNNKPVIMNPPNKSIEVVKPSKALNTESNKTSSSGNQSTGDEGKKEESK